MRRLCELMATLRSVDVAELMPERSVRARMLRGSAAAAIEREIVGTLCGAAWSLAESALRQAADARRTSAGDVAQELNPSEELARVLAPLLWFDADRLEDLFDETRDEPFELLDALLDATGERRGDPSGRHLMLTFFRRGMAGARGDREALRWAWGSVRRGRMARTCYLAAPEELRLAWDGDDLAL